MGSFNSILILITFALFLLTEYRPAFRKYVVVTAVQVIAISSLVSAVINQWLLPAPNLAYGIQIGVFLTTALLVRAFRNQ